MSIFSAAQFGRILSLTGVDLAARVSRVHPFFPLSIGASVNSFFWKCLPVLAIALVITGCGSGPSLYKAGGTVTYKGQPVSNAAVTFYYGEDDGNFAVGQTDTNGKFNLSYLGSPKGAKPGKCNVSVTKFETTSVAAPKTTDPLEMTKAMAKIGDEQKKKQGAGGGEPAGPKNDLPAKYANVKTSGLTYEITTDEKKNDFAIVLAD